MFGTKPDPSKVLTKAMARAAEQLDISCALRATPFRYDPKRGVSRFRAATDPGVFNGAEFHQDGWRRAGLLALLTPAGFAKPKSHAERQTWHRVVSPREVTLRRDTESMQFSAKG